jgi:hypothetical protein
VNVSIHSHHCQGNTTNILAVAFSGLAHTGSAEPQGLLPQAGTMALASLG